MILRPITLLRSAEVREAVRQVVADTSATAIRSRAQPERGTELALKRLEQTQSRFNMTKAGRLESVRVLEELFFDLVATLDTGLFLEAGAKAAEASRRASQLLPGVPVVAFEANPYTFKRFDRKIDYQSEGVQYRNQALSSEPGSLSFNVRKTEDGKPAADGQGSLLKHTSYEPGHIQVTVPAVTLDSALDEFDGDNCALWIDVEGATRQVLGGAARTLQKASVVFVEVEDIEYWGSQWLSEEVVRALYEAGLHPVARDFQSRYQWNVVCVRKSLLFSPKFLEAVARYHQRVNRIQRAP